MPEKLLIIQAAALGAALAPPGYHTAETVFPAVTCAAQASFRTAAAPDHHGMISNGVHIRELKKTLFWEQAASLVEGERIWKKFRESGRRVGMMFWQQSLGEEADLILSPAPIHKHSGGMIQDCYSKPRDLYPRLKSKIGRPFNLMNYWGPLASRRSSDWITAATCAVMEHPEFAPDLLFTYLPHLDYALQASGPDSLKAGRAKAVTHNLLKTLIRSAESNGYEWLVFGDYAITPAGSEVAFPNRALRRAGLFHTREISGMQYGDYFSSGAFAMVDHQVAHVYTTSPAMTAAAARILKEERGIAEVLDREAQRDWGVGHGRAGDLVLVAEPGAWFAYPWWEKAEKAPDFASHVDIHNKPGYDPCELFFGWPPPGVSQDVWKVKGSHGRTGPGTSVGWKSSLKFEAQPGTLIEIAEAVKHWLDDKC